MAILRSTSKGQLGKYVIPTLEMLQSAMKNGTPVKRGSKPSMRLKKTSANIDALKIWASIGNDKSRQVEALNIQLEVTDRFKSRLIDEGYNPSYGARPLRRAVMRLLEDSLAEKVLGEEIKAGDTVVVDVGADNKIKVLLGEKFDFVEET